MYSKHLPGTSQAKSKTEWESRKRGKKLDSKKEMLSLWLTWIQKIWEQFLEAFSQIPILFILLCIFHWLQKTLWPQANALKLFKLSDFIPVQKVFYLMELASFPLRSLKHLRWNIDALWYSVLFWSKNQFLFFSTAHVAFKKRLFAGGFPHTYTQRLLTFLFISIVPTFD